MPKKLELKKYLVEIGTDAGGALFSEAVEAENEDDAKVLVYDRAKKLNPELFAEGTDPKTTKVSDYTGDIPKPKRSKK